MTVSALDPNDRRSVTVDVAGDAALLVSEAHKLHDRVASGKPDRLDDKDAADVCSNHADDVAYRRQRHARACSRTRSLVSRQEKRFSTSVSCSAAWAPGIRMAARALRVGIPEDRVEAICIAYMSALRQGVS